MKFLDETGLKFIASKFKELRESLANKVDKVENKQLSTNYYTNEAKAKVDAIPTDPKYTDTVQDLSEYAKKEEIITPKERQQLKLHGEGYIQSFVGEISVLLLMRLHNTASIKKKRGGVFAFIDELVFREDGSVKDKTELNSIGPNTLIQAYQQYAISQSSKAIVDEDGNNISVDKLSNRNLTIYIDSHVFYSLRPEYSLKETIDLMSRDFVAKDDINKLMTSIPTLKKEVVTSLPTSGKDDVIYLIKDEKGKDNNNYLEYLWIDNKWELIGSTKVDLTNYAKKEDVNTKLNVSSKAVISSNINWEDDKSYTTPKFVSNAVGALNTEILGSIQEEIDKKANVEDILASKIMDVYKLDKDLYTALSNDQEFLKAVKRDKLTLVVFSGNNKTSLAKESGLESILYYKGDVVGVSPLASDGDIGRESVVGNKLEKNDLYITNHFMHNYNEIIQSQINQCAKTKLSEMTDDSTHRLVTDAEKTAWNNKLDSVSGKDISRSKTKGYNTSNTWSSLSTNRDLEDWIGDFDKRTRENKTELAKKVDSVSGKGLSSNDFTNAFLNKLNSIKQQVILTQSDYNALSSTDKNDSSKIYFIKG